MQIFAWLNALLGTKLLPSVHIVIWWTGGQLSIRMELGWWWMGLGWWMMIVDDGEHYSSIQCYCNHPGPDTTLHQKILSISLLVLICHNLRAPHDWALVININVSNKSWFVAVAQLVRSWWEGGGGCCPMFQCVMGYMMTSSLCGHMNTKPQIRGNLQITYHKHNLAHTKNNYLSILLFGHNSRWNITK